MKLAEFGDQVITGKKEFIEITSRRQKVVVEGYGQVHIPPKNTHDLKNGWEHTLNECRKIVEGAGNAVNRLKNIGDDILDVMESSGGHTLDRHVGKSKEYLIERTKKLKGKGATTYISKDTATKSVKDVISKNSTDIVKWLNNSNDARLIIKTDHSFDVGNGVLKNTDILTEGLRKTVTVIERTSDNELGFRIITSYPVFN